MPHTAPNWSVSNLASGPTWSRTGPPPPSPEPSAIEPSNVSWLKQRPPAPTRCSSSSVDTRLRAESQLARCSPTTAGGNTVTPNATRPPLASPSCGTWLCRAGPAEVDGRRSSPLMGLRFGL
eukprot:scaffold2424_cov407-Prasinococcus_capsulatus_cf.AAC.4